ncbi:MAG TPA: NAD(P)-binding protein [Opitutaceae bacterium]|jgi:2-polyprenyl-6-methoxyphenol hydroxylase-like FAD-dependent oxidoreductase|nr:NAD(P)-binding protein [Opitutaceae bacterium]
MRPIEIVGGGVGGLALGIALRREGVDVTVFEAGEYPRHRVCGEFISGLKGATLEALGIKDLLSDSSPHNGVTYFMRDEPMRPFRLPGTAWGISRHTLDARLADAFVKAGGILRTATRVPEDETPPGRVFAMGRRRKGPFWVGLKVHVPALPLANDFEVHLGNRAYVGLSRVESGAVNVCGLFAQRETAARGLDLLPEYLREAGLGVLAKRLESAGMDPATFCATAAPLGDAAVAATDRIRIGDACASIAPFTGNGLAMALQGAETALPCLLSYSSGALAWGDVVQRVSRGQRNRFRKRLRLSSFLHPFFLERRRQAVLAALARRNLIPFGAFYAVLH